MSVRASLGTAAALGLRAGGGEVAPTTAYLMLGDSCPRNCAFCAQGSESTAGAGKLSRVTWPAFSAAELLPRLESACREGRFARICVQTVATASARDELRSLLGVLRSALPVPVSASVYVRDLAELERLFGAGLSRAGLALDAAAADVYRDVKGGDLKEAMAFLERAAAAFPGRVSTHVIVGLGETEEDVLSLVQWCADRGVAVGLFAFTPVRGTRLAGRRPPDLKAYRRIQAAAYLISRREVRIQGLRFAGGRLAGTGLAPARLAALLAGGDAFRTTGCPGCNRPYYNERPGRVPYNYPRPLTCGEARAALAEVPGHGCGGVAR